MQKESIAFHLEKQCFVRQKTMLYSLLRRGFSDYFSCPYPSSAVSWCFNTLASMKKTISSAMFVMWSPARSSLRKTLAKLMQD